MKLFIFFILLCFIGASFLNNRSMRINQWMLFGVVLAVCVLYFFFRQI